jgi:hypothetical protein
MNSEATGLMTPSTVTTITSGDVSFERRDEGKRVKERSSAKVHAHLESIQDYTIGNPICYPLPWCQMVVWRGLVCIQDSMALPDPGDRHALIQDSRCIDL